MNRINKKSQVIDDGENKIFLKQTDKDIEGLFEYLHQKGFDYVPKIVETSTEGVKYKYIDTKKTNITNKRLELSKILSLLHYKTSYHKDISKHKYREVYDKLSEKIEYTEKIYNDLIEKIEMEVYPSPSHYLLERNFSIILGSLNFSKIELKKWFKLVENKTKERVSIVNNNPKVEHLIIGDNTYLTNWDSYMVDTPIIDLYKLYKEDQNYNDFYDMYQEYSKNFNLTLEEKKLFFIIISIPPKLLHINPEIINTKNTKEIINYLYKTNEFITLVNSKKEVNNKTN